MGPRVVLPPQTQASALLQRQEAWLYLHERDNLHGLDHKPLSLNEVEHVCLNRVHSIQIEYKALVPSSFRFHLIECASGWRALLSTKRRIIGWQVNFVDCGKTYALDENHAAIFGWVNILYILYHKHNVNKILRRTNKNRN